MMRRNTTQKTARATVTQPRQPVPSAGELAFPRTFAPVGICIALALTVAAVYAQTASFEFLYFDDDNSVFKNEHILGGVTSKSLVWAFTEYHAGYWQPATAISHMVDVELYHDPLSPFEQWAGGHHLTNVLLHACNSILLFLLLRRLTGALWPSAFAAALFALHPMRVESVAWVTERKDMLSGFFFLATLHAYASYAQRPSLLRYLLIILPFILGLMSKPMVVTLPFVLLLLDWWPLGRMRRTADSPTIARLLAEKVPLLALALAFSLITVSAQGEAVKSIKDFPPLVRISNALVSYVAYIRQTLWPSDLAAFYPHPKDTLPAWQIAGAVALLIAITVAAVRSRSSRPYLLFGWLWYVGMLAPVIGLMQSGIQARADRFTYLPHIGLIVGLTWLAADLVVSWQLKPSVLAVAGFAVIAAFMLVSWQQTAPWHDTVKLYKFTLTRTAQNYFIEYYLGITLGREGTKLRREGEQLEADGKLLEADGKLLEADGKLLEAAKHLHQANLISPDTFNIQYDYGRLLHELGRYEEAAQHLRRSVELMPTDFEAAINLGGVLHQWAKQSQTMSDAKRSRILDEAWHAAEQARGIDPESDIVYFNMGTIRAEQGKMDEAIAFLRQSIDRCTARVAESNEPVPKQLGHVYASLGTAYYKTDKKPEALQAFRQALRLQPDDWHCLGMAAEVAAMNPDPAVRSGIDAVNWAERAVKIKDQDPHLIAVLAAAYAEAGRFPEAERTGERALKLAVEQEVDAETIKKIQSQIASYHARVPVREQPGKAGAVDH